MAIGVENEKSIALRTIMSKAAEAKRDFLLRTKNMCKSPEKLIREICEMRRKARAMKVHMTQLAYSKNKCRYTNDEEGCMKSIDMEVEKIQELIKNLDDRMRKKQQKLK